MYLPIFEKKDFTLCNLPVPDGYPQSQTHAGIACYDGRFYLTCSPYPVKKFTWISAHWYALLQKISGGRWGRIPDAEKFENPMLYIGDGDYGNPAVNFIPLEPFPLMPTPMPVFGLPAYNSDPDIFIEEGDVYVLNRTYYRRTSENGESVKEVLISMIKGKVDNLGYHFGTISEFKRSNDSLISPCLTKYQEKYLFTWLETNSAIDGHSFEGLYMQQSDTIDGLKGGSATTKIEIASGDLLPWHMSLFIYEETLFAIVACVKRGDISHIWQMMGEFNADLSELTIYQRPLTDYNSYRGAAIVVNGDFILYTTTLNDNVRGSKSVDGRDIIMTKMNIGKIIEIVRQNEVI